MSEFSLDVKNRYLCTDNQCFTLGYFTPKKAFQGDLFRYRFYMPAAPTVNLVLIGPANAACSNNYRANGGASTEAYNTNQHTWGPIAHDVDVSGADTFFLYDIGAVLTANGFAAADYVGLEVVFTTVTDGYTCAITGAKYIGLVGLKVNDVLL